MEQQVYGGQKIENPGSLNEFIALGGTQEEWQQKAADFFNHRQSFGLTDSELLNGQVEIDFIRSDKERIGA